jgi:hypothetical protein
MSKGSVSPVQGALRTCTTARRSSGGNSEAGSTTRGRTLQGWSSSSCSTRRKPATRVAVAQQHVL